MAEIGLIASVIQVAGAGLKLSTTLYQYAESVSTADKRIKDIARDVKLTSHVIDELGGIFKQDETASLLSKNAVNTAQETVRECSNVFEEMDAALKKSKKNTFGRLMMPFREPKMELLRANIDRLKSTLQLLMQVLTHAHQVASHKADKDEVAVQRHHIKVLIKAKKDSTKRYEESLRNYSPSDESTLLNEDDTSINTRDLDIATENRAGAPIMALSIGSTITKTCLESCVAHIQKLLKDIELVQYALSSKIEGEDTSEHEQNLVGSYFSTREYLDSILLGGLGPRRTDSGLSGETLGMRRTRGRRHLQYSDGSRSRSRSRGSNGASRKKKNKIAEAAIGALVVHGLANDPRSRSPRRRESRSRYRSWSLSRNDNAGGSHNLREIDSSVEVEEAENAASRKAAQLETQKAKVLTRVAKEVSESKIEEKWVERAAEKNADITFPDIALGEAGWDALDTGKKKSKKHKKKIQKKEETKEEDAAAAIATAAANIPWAKPQEAAAEGDWEALIPIKKSKKGKKEMKKPYNMTEAEDVDEVKDEGVAAAPAPAATVDTSWLEPQEAAENDWEVCTPCKKSKKGKKSKRKYLNNVIDVPIDAFDDVSGTTTVDSVAKPSEEPSEPLPPEDAGEEGAIAEAKVAEEKAKKEHEESTARLGPLPDEIKPAVMFVDAIGRKFAFPWHLARSWKAMEELIKISLADMQGPIYEQFTAGHYDFIGPVGEIILPQIWETLIEPGMAIRMRIWPIPDPPVPLREVASPLPPPPHPSVFTGALPISRPDSPYGPEMSPERTTSPLGTQRALSATAIPLRFRRPLLSLGSSSDLMTNHPSPFTPTSSLTDLRLRHGKSASAEFSRSTEYRPLYIVERKTPEIEETLPSQLSSRMTSTTPSEHDTGDEYWSAHESPYLSGTDNNDPFTSPVQYHDMHAKESNATTKPPPSKYLAPYSDLSASYGLRDGHGKFDEGMNDDTRLVASEVRYYEDEGRKKRRHKRRAGTEDDNTRSIVSEDYYDYENGMRSKRRSKQQGSRDDSNVCSSAAKYCSDEDYERRRKRRSRRDDDDTRSIVSENRYDEDDERKERRAGGGIFGLFSSNSKHSRSLSSSPHGISVSVYGRDDEKSNWEPRRTPTRNDTIYNTIMTPGADYAPEAPEDECATSYRRKKGARKSASKKDTPVEVTSNIATPVQKPDPVEEALLDLDEIVEPEIIQRERQHSRVPTASSIDDRGDFEEDGDEVDELLSEWTTLKKPEFM